jgi:hypothetical protein
MFIRTIVLDTNDRQDRLNPQIIINLLQSLRQDGGRTAAVGQQLTTNRRGIGKKLQKLSYTLERFFLKKLEEKLQKLFYALEHFF